MSICRERKQSPGMKSPNKIGPEFSRASFQHFRQSGRMTCGPACLRMISHWASGVSRPERFFLREHWWTEAKGMLPQQMLRAIRALATHALANGVRLDVEPLAKSQRRQLLRRPTDLGGGSAVSLLRIDSFAWCRVKLENVGHWIVVTDIKRVRCRSVLRYVAVCYDPSLPQSDNPYLWDWRSLCAAQLTARIDIRRDRGWH